MKKPTIAGIRRIPLKDSAQAAAPGASHAFLPPHEARRMVYVLDRARTMREVDAAMAYANVMLEGHGVEGVYGQSSDDLVALYVNMGDQYAQTVIADLPAKRFYLTDLETWVLKRQKKYGIA